MTDTPQDAESFLLQQRKAQLEAVAEMFARYGQQVYDLILQAIRHKHGLPLLLQRLGVSVPRSHEKQLEALAVFLSENGNGRFLRLAGAEPARPVPKETRPPCAPAPPPPSHSTAVTPPEAAPQFDDHGKYIGSERRSGVERRAGGDRRNLSETINRNKRYGGDRRKVLRRQCDRVAAAALGLRPCEYPPLKA